MAINQKYYDKWALAGASQNWMVEDPYGAKALIDSRLIYSIMGFDANGQSCGLQFDRKTKSIQVKKEGVFVNARDLQMHWSSDFDQPIDAKNRPWLYLPEGGLRPINRMDNSDLIPVMKIHPSMKEGILALSCKVEKQADCVLQIVSHPREVLPEHTHWLLANFRRHIPIDQHVTIRIIDKEGQVYSTGFDYTYLEEKNNKNGQILCSVNGKPSTLDFEEFRQHQGRITTSYGISDEQCQTILDDLQNYRKKGVRYNVLKQNCNTIPVSFLNRLGIQDENHKIDISTDLKGAIFDSLPTIPLISKPTRSLVGQIKLIFNASPKCIQVIIRIAKEVLLFFPNIILNVIINLCLLLLGSCRGSPLEDSLISEDEQLEFFETLGFSLLSNRNFTFDSPCKFVEFQLRQKHTIVEKYDSPIFGLAPRDNAELHQRLQDIYLGA
ncbi:MAG: hypothetical protein H7A39_05245 [Chlamydiales bacterium]|nr:hypothetical protein [Chlamydiales bacterium]